MQATTRIVGSQLKGMNASLHDLIEYAGKCIFSKEASVDAGHSRCEPLRLVTERHKQPLTWPAAIRCLRRTSGGPKDFELTPQQAYPSETAMMKLLFRNSCGAWNL